MRFVDFYFLFIYMFVRLFFSSRFSPVQSFIYVISVIAVAAPLVSRLKKCAARAPQTDGRYIIIIMFLCRRRRR